jgi:hypothetical protein
MAQKKRVKVTYKQGSENTLSGLGTFFIIFGIIGLIACFIWSGYTTKDSVSDTWKWNLDDLSVFRLAIGIALLIYGITVSVLCKALADIIRLLKKLNKLDFSGNISQPYTKVELRCSECGTTLEQDQVQCPNPDCNVEFE